MTEGMSRLEAMRRRTSRRQYTAPPSHAEMDELRHAVATANLKSGLDIRLVEDGSEAFDGITKSYGLFSGVHTIILLAGPARDENLKEKAGYYGEEIVLRAVELGLGVCWVGGTFDRKTLAATLPPGAQLVAVVTVGRVKPEKGFVEKAVRRVTGAGNKRAKDLYMTETEEETLPEWFLAGVDAAALAPSAMNRRPVRFGLKNGVVKAAVPEAAGLNMVDLGIAKLHFEIGAGGKFALGNGAALKRDA